MDGADRLVGGGFAVGAGTRADEDGFGTAAGGDLTAELRGGVNGGEAAAAVIAADGVTSGGDAWIAVAGASLPAEVASVGVAVAAATGEL